MDSVEQTIALHKNLIENFEKNSLAPVRKAAEMITACFLADKTLYLCGNGGSASDCQHIAGEFIGRFRKERRALNAIAFSTNTSILTCLGNDYDFNIVFKRQIEGAGKPGDILWAFSTSGTSKNIIAAVEEAKKHSMEVIAFTGKSGTPLEKMSDVCICASSEVTSSSQEVHILAYHIICDLVEQNICNQKK